MTVFWGRPFSVCQTSTWAWVRGRPASSAAEAAGRKSSSRKQQQPHEPPHRSSRVRSAHSVPSPPATRWDSHLARVHMPEAAESSQFYASGSEANQERLPSPYGFGPK